VGHLSLIGLGIVQEARTLAQRVGELPEEERIAALNEVRVALHEVSPFHTEPVDCVLWVPGEEVEANDYNPNVVAPPEMRLLEISIDADGFTQPIVTFPTNGHREVVDGFHRNLVAKRSKSVNKRLRGYLPVTTIRSDRQSREDRIAATIRHNRARGQHQVADMSEIVVELSRRNWSDEKIGRELGMDPDEVLRLKQISGLAELFADQEFSEAWEVD
jgi:ParB-like chromosome segregation protein Spo0J